MIKVKYNKKGEVVTMEYSTDLNLKDKFGIHEKDLAEELSRVILHRAKTGDPKKFDHTLYYFGKIFKLSIQIFKISDQIIEANIFITNSFINQVLTKRVNHTNLFH